MTKTLQPSLLNPLFYFLFPVQSCLDLSSTPQSVCPCHSFNVISENDNLCSVTTLMFHVCTETGREELMIIVLNTSIGLVGLWPSCDLWNPGCFYCIECLEVSSR